MKTVHTFFRATQAAMTLLTAAAAGMLGEVLTVPAYAVPALPRQIETVLGGLILYLLTALVCAAALRGSDSRPGEKD